MKVNKSFYCLIIITVTTIAYWNSFDVPFQFDDHHSIQNNPGIRNLSDLKRVFNSFPQRPVAQLTFALNYHFHELDVWGYHLVNLVIHIINSLLVFWLVMQILQLLYDKKSIALDEQEILFMAFSAGMLFAVHPVQTQAVTYIVQRMASLASLFYLLSVNLFLMGRRSLGNNRHYLLWFILSFITGLLGIFTKQIVFTLPIMILMFEWVLFNDITLLFKKHKKKVIIVTLIFVGFLLLLPLVYKIGFDKIFSTIPPQQGHSYTLTPYTYFLTQLRVHITYIRIAFIPYNLHLDYNYPVSVSLFEWKVILSGLFLAGLLNFAIKIRKINPLITISLLWYFISSIVESSIMPIGNVIFEHRLYLPMAGLCILMAQIINYIKYKNKLMVFAMIIVLFLFLTYDRNNIWKSPLSLSEDSIIKSPQKARTINNLASNKLSNYEFLESYLLLKNGLDINSDYTILYQNLHTLHLKIGLIDHDDTLYIDQLTEKEKNKQKFVQTLYFMNRNMTEQASSLLDSIVADIISPTTINDLLRLSYELDRSTLFNKLTDYSDSLFLLTTDDRVNVYMYVSNDSSIYEMDDINIKKINNNHVKANYLKFLSKKYYESGNIVKAVEYITEALNYSKDYDSYKLRGIIYYNNKNYLFAALDFSSAFELSKNPEFVLLRAKCYQMMGNSQSAENEIKFYEVLKSKEDESKKLW